MSANPVFVGGSGTITNFLIMYRHIRKSVKNDRFLHRLNYFDNLESLGIIEFPSMTKYPLMRRKKKTVKNDRFLYIPSKFYSRNSYILQGFSDFCLIPYYEEKVSNEDVNVVARLFQPCTMGEIRIMPTKLCGFPDLKCLYMESDLQKNG